nr:MAG TPA: hypothetical protein [Caudoviricetes sp.]
MRSEPPSQQPSSNNTQSLINISGRESKNTNGRLPSMGIATERRLPGLLESRASRDASRGG